MRRSAITPGNRRAEAVRLLDFSLAAVRDHAETAVSGKRADVKTANPGEVLFQLAIVYARYSEVFRKDTSLEREHADRLSEQYASCSMKLLKGAEKIGFFDKDDDDHCNCRRLRSQKELQLLSNRRDFQELGLPKGRGVMPQP